MLSEKRGKHSEKPVNVYRIIEKAYPTLKKIELFARNDKEGWKRWGVIYLRKFKLVSISMYSEKIAIYKYELYTLEITTILKW